MPSLRRIDRHLSIEELEPRIAPAPLVLSGTGQRTAIITDADGDRIFISLSGSRASRVEIADLFGNTPSSADIASVTFTQANRQTALTFSFAPGGSGRNTLSLGTVDANGFTLGSFIAPGNVSSFVADEVRLLRLSGAGGDINGPITLDRFVAGERVEADDLAAAGSFTVTSWTGGTLVLTGNLSGLVDGSNAIPGRVSVGGNMTGTGLITSAGIISNVAIGGNVNAGAIFSSFAGFGAVSVGGAAGFGGTMVAGPAGIASLAVNAGPLWGMVASTGPLRTLTVAQDLTSALVTSVGTTTTLRAAGIDAASVVNVTGDILSTAITGGTGIRGSITASGAMGPVRVTGGSVGPNPAPFQPNLLAGGGFTGGVSILGNLDGTIAATSGAITGVTLGGSLNASGQLQNTATAGPGIGTVVVDGPTFAGGITSGTDIGSVRATAAVLGAASVITAGRAIGGVNALGVAAGAQILTGSGGFGALNVAGNFDGGLTVGGATGITGGVTLGGNLSGSIFSVGPVSAPVNIGRNLSATGSLQAGSAGTAITAPLTIGGDLAGRLTVSGGHRQGQITIGGNVTATSVIRSVGDLSRNLSVGGNFNGRLDVLNSTAGAIVLAGQTGHATPNTAQYLSLFPLGFPLDVANRITESEPNNSTASPQVLASVPVAISGTITGRTATDGDFFQFTANVGQALRFDVDAIALGSPLVAGISLRDANGLLLRSVDTGSAALDPEFQYVFVSTGTYIAEIHSSTTGAGAGSGAYKFYLQGIHLPFTMGVDNDVVYIAGSIDTTAESDWYSLWIDQPTPLAVDLDAGIFGSPLRAQIEVYNSAGALIAMSNDGPQADPAERSPDPILSFTGPNADPDMNITVPGLYYVRVLSNPSIPTTGPYKLYLSTGSPQGYKTEEWGNNDLRTTANIVTVGQGTSGTGVPAGMSTVAPVATTISGVLRITPTTQDEDWFQMFLDTPAAGQNVTYVFDIDTYTYGPNVGEPFAFPNANLRLAVFTAAGAPVFDTATVLMDNQSEEVGEIDPLIQWTPRLDFGDGNYVVRVSFDVLNPAQRVPSNTYYDLRITRVFWGITRAGAPAGMLPEVEQNRFLATAQDITFGTMASFVIRDLNGTVGYPLGGLALQGVLATPGTTTDPFPLGDLDIYRFTAFAGQELNFNLKPTVAQDPTGQVNAVVKLYDVGGNLLATNDNKNFGLLSTSGTTGTPVIQGVRDFWPYLTVVAPQTGTYFLEVSGAQPAPVVGAFPVSTGTYQMLLTKRGIRVNESSPMLDPVPTAGAGAGWMVSGIDLTRTQPQIVTGLIGFESEFDRYNFAITAGTTVGFQLITTTLEGRIQIVDAGGRVLVENTGFGPSGNPTLTHQFTTGGNYQIVVSSNPSGTTRTGPYSLLVTKDIADVSGNIAIAGDLAGAGLTFGQGLISLPGSLFGSLSARDVIGNARIEVGQDAWNVIGMRNLGQASAAGPATGSVWVGGHIRPTGQVRLSGNLGDTANVFTRFADGLPGPSSASLRVDGAISPRSQLVVAPPGGLTGRGNVFLDSASADVNIFTPVTLYNLDSSGTLTGLFAEVTRYAGNFPDFGDTKTYALNRDYVAAGFNPSTGAGTPGIQVQIYYAMDRYHSFMSLMGYGSLLNRVIYASENETVPTGYPAISADIDYNPSIWGIRIPNTNGQSLGSMGDLMLHLYNRALNEDLVQLHAYLSAGPVPLANNQEAPAIDSGLADYRAASLTHNPWIGESRTDFPVATLISAGYMRLADNVYRLDPSQYSAWGTSGPRLGGRVLTGILWDLRNVLGQDVVDTLAMAGLDQLDKASTQALGTPLQATFGPVTSPFPGAPNFLDAIIAADGRLYPADRVMHADRIRQAFAIHGVGTYDFTSTSTTSGAPVGTDATLFGQPMLPGEVVTRTFYKAGATVMTVTFDNIVTKLEYGETITLRDGTGGIPVGWVDYTPPVDILPPNQAGVDFGRGLQGRTFTVPGNTVIITLYTDLDADLSLGFRAFIDPPVGALSFVPSGASFLRIPGAPASSATGGSSALLQSLLGIVSTSSLAPTFTGTSTSSAASTTPTVSDIGRESVSLSLPAAAPAGTASEVFTLKVYSSVGEAGSAAQPEGDGLTFQPATQIL